MKKYIIGLFSAICLMWAGCDKQQEFNPVDMGEGPSVAVSLIQQEGEDDAFTLTVTPAEGTVYYAYWLTNDSLSLDPDNLLQGKYEGVKIVDAADKPSVTEEFTAQEVGVTYYVYAVAADKSGLCGSIASASLFLPDKVAPHLINIPEGYLYNATNNSRSVTLTFNETVTRGSGAISYDVTKGDLTSYANGVIETVAIDGESVTITLPESVVFDENEPKTYVFLDFAAGAFVDASGNQSAAMKGGVIDNLVSAPYWEYVPGEPGGGDTNFTGTFGFLYCPIDFDAWAPTTDIYGFDSEFVLKHENNPDTILIQDFYFYPESFEIGSNTLEAVVEGNNFKIAQMFAMGVAPMENQVTGQKYNVLICFAGYPETDTEVLEWVTFEEKVVEDLTSYVADHWCGLFLLDYDLIEDVENKDLYLGWNDLWAPAMFVRGSIKEGQSLAASQIRVNSMAPMVNKSNVKCDWSRFRPLNASEKIKVQKAVKSIKTKYLR